MVGVDSGGGVSFEITFHLTVNEVNNSTVHGDNQYNSSARAHGGAGLVVGSHWYRAE